MDKQIVKKITNLARIELTEKEEELYSSQLETILDYFKLLNEVNTDGVDVGGINSQENIIQMREDKEDGLNRDFDRKILLGGISDKMGEFVKVKEVFKKI